MVKRGIAMACLCGVAAVVALSSLSLPALRREGEERGHGSGAASRPPNASGEAGGARRLRPAPTVAKLAADEIGRILRRGSESERQRALEISLPALAVSDPAVARALVESLEPWAWREEASLAFARAWAAVDAAAAYAWATQPREEEERARLVQAICRRTATGDPAQALAWAGREAGAAGAELRGSLLEQWAAHDFTEASRWLEGAAAEPEREALGYRLAVGRAMAAPAEAAAWAAQKLPAGPWQDQAVAAVLHRWALADPASAAAWVESFPAGDLQERARAEIAGVRRRLEAQAQELSQP